MKAKSTINKSVQRFLGMAAMGLLVVILAACGSLSAAPASGSSELREVPVTDVQVQVGVGSPIPVDIFVSGAWPDLCAQLAEIQQSIEGRQIELTLLATPVEANCPPDYVGVPFRIAVPLNAVELPAGSYTVVANGVSTTFEWE